MAVDFQGQKLRRKSKDFWNNKDLRGAIFSGADLSASDLRGLNLAGACFDGALLYSTRFDEAKLTEASFQRVCAGRTWARAILIETLVFLTAGLSAFVAVALLVILETAGLRSAYSTNIWVEGVAGFCLGIGSMSFFAMRGLRAGAGAAVAVVIAAVAFGAVVGFVAPDFGLEHVVFLVGGAVGGGTGAVGVSVSIAGAVAVAGAVGVAGAVVGAVVGGAVGLIIAAGAVTFDLALAVVGSVALLFVVFTLIFDYRTSRRH
jgi:hypothetical protein